MFGEEKLTLSFSREKLLKALHANKQKHADEHKAAMLVYKERAEEALKGQLSNIYRGKEFSLDFKLIEPKSYEESYDDAISMIEFCQDESIQLDQSQYKKFVQDKWEWQQSFGMTKTLYGIG